jgi:hypothetical protein
MEANLSNLIVEKGLALGQEVVATEKGIRIGRAKSNDLVLDEPLVSRHHCRVFFKAGRLYLADLGSANGTEVNGQPAQAYNLRIGDRISIGNSIIKVISDTMPDSGMSAKKTGSQSASKVPPGLALGLWILLIGWCMFLIYTLILYPGQSATPVQEQPQTGINLTPVEITPAATTQPVPLPPAETNAPPVSEPDPAEAAVAKFKTDLFATLMDEKFIEASQLCRQFNPASLPEKTRSQIQSWMELIERLPTIDQTLAAAFEMNIGSKMAIFSNNRKVIIIPVAIAGKTVTATIADGGRIANRTAFTLDHLPVSERCRLIGESDTAEMAVLKIILLIQAKDYKAAETYIPKAGALAPLFEANLPSAP